MIIEQLRNLLIFGVIMAMVIAVNIVYKSNKSICPDDFKNPNQEIASFYEWAKEFVDENPNATMSEFSQARRDFYVENKCKEALKRYDDYMAGNVDEETRQLIEMTIKKEIKNSN